MNQRRKFLLGVAAVAAGLASPLSLSWDDAYAAYLPVTQPTWNALDYNIKGDGSTDDSFAINQFLANATTTGAACWFPGARTYIIGSSQILVPQGCNAVAASTAIFTRNADPGTAGASWPTTYNGAGGAAFSLGSNATWTGGSITNTAKLTTSTTSVTPGLGSKTWTVGAGVNIAVGNFIRIQSDGTGSTHMEGTVTAYTGTTLTVNVAFFNGTAHTDWSIYATGVWQAPITCDNCTYSKIELTTITGNWYVGFILSGWNAAGGTKITQNCIVSKCRAIGIFNRGFYQYGTCTHNEFDNCFVDGVLGTTDYGFNNNPANPSGTINNISYSAFSNCQTVNTLAQGMAFGDLVFYTTLTNCIVNATVSVSGTGFLVQAANNGGANQPQFFNISNCIAKNCPSAGFTFQGTAWINATGVSAISCGQGFQIVGNGVVNCAEVSIQNLVAEGCTTGVIVAASQVNTLLTGRTTANTTNYNNAGTGTNAANLIVV